MSNSTQSSRASKAVRIMLLCCSALLIIASILAGINMYAVNTYNDATQTLQSIIKQAQKPDADIKQLYTHNAQVLNQFHSLDSLKPVTLAETQRAVAANSAVAAQLQDRMKHMLDEQNKQASRNDAHNNDDAQEGSASANPALSDEQRQKVEDMLKSNEAQQDNTDQSNNDNHENQSNNNTKHSDQIKPW